VRTMQVGLNISLEAVEKPLGVGNLPKLDHQNRSLDRNKCNVGHSVRSIF
jgi:hypothetical protein